MMNHEAGVGDLALILDVKPDCDRAFVKLRNSSHEVKNLQNILKLQKNTWGSTQPKAKNHRDMAYRCEALQIWRSKAYIIP